MATPDVTAEITLPISALVGGSAWELDVICDPACGTAGFLVESGEYLLQHHKDLFTNSETTKHFNEKCFNRANQGAASRLAPATCATIDAPDFSRLLGM